MRTKQEGYGFAASPSTSTLTIAVPACRLMIVCIIVFGAQLLVTIAALVYESGEDDRFKGDKLIYRG